MAEGVAFGAVVVVLEKPVEAFGSVLAVGRGCIGRGG